MPILSRRTAAPLLRQVNRKPHATNDDHIDQLPTPPGTNNSSRSSLISPTCAMEEDITRSPESSEDEAGNARAPEPQIPFKRSSFQPSRQVEENEGEGAKKSSTFRRSAQVPSSPHSERSKRSRDDDEEKGNSSDGDGIFGPERKKKTSSGSSPGFANIHAPIAAARRTKVTQYGSKSQARDAPRKETKFRKREEERRSVEPPPRPKFQKARGMDDDMFEFGSGDPISSGGFRSSGPLGDVGGYTTTAMVREKGSLSPTLSSLSPDRSSPAIEGIQLADDIATQEDSTSCPICSSPISSDNLIRFQATFTQSSGPILNYRWQQRFCRWHKQQDAQTLSTERGYPDIDWDRLPARMRKCERHLRRVIKGEEGSFYRDQLKDVLGSGKMKTALGALAAEGGVRRDRGGCGYYGPKGERVMIEHIISHLSAEIRRQSTRDRLVAAAGVSGGVSGFVQAVLVPELAERLICEDMKVERTRAREIMVDSAEVGDLLHPDANDLVGEQVELDG